MSSQALNSDRRSLANTKEKETKRDGRRLLHRLQGSRSVQGDRGRSFLLRFRATSDPDGHRIICSNRTDFFWDRRLVLSFGESYTSGIVHLESWTRFSSFFQQCFRGVTGFDWRSNAVRTRQTFSFTCKWTNEFPFRFFFFFFLSKDRQQDKQKLYIRKDGQI